MKPLDRIGVNARDLIIEIDTALTPQNPDIITFEEIK